MISVRLSRRVCVRQISLGGEGNALYAVLSSSCCCCWVRSVCAYTCHLASGVGIVTLSVHLSRCVCVCQISLGGEGNAQYPVLSSRCCCWVRSICTYTWRVETVLWCSASICHAVCVSAKLVMAAKVMRCIQCSVAVVVVINVCLCQLLCSWRSRRRWRHSRGLTSTVGTITNRSSLMINC